MHELLLLLSLRVAPTDSKNGIESLITRQDCVTTAFKLKARATKLLPIN